MDRSFDSRGAIDSRGGYALYGIPSDAGQSLNPLAEEEGYDLTEDQLESIAGGGWSGGAGVYVECWYYGERISPYEDWCPECGIWLGEGEEPNFAPAREDHELGIRTKG